MATPAALGRDAVTVLRWPQRDPLLADQTPPAAPLRISAREGPGVGRWPGIPADIEGAPFLSRPLFSLHEGAWSPDRPEREAGPLSEDQV